MPLEGLLSSFLVGLGSNMNFDVNLTPRFAISNTCLDPCAYSQLFMQLIILNYAVPYCEELSAVIMRVILEVLEPNNVLFYHHGRENRGSKYLHALRNRMGWACYNQWKKSLVSPWSDTRRLVVIPTFYVLSQLTWIFYLMYTFRNLPQELIYMTTPLQFYHIEIYGLCV